MTRSSQILRAFLAAAAIAGLAGTARGGEAEEVSRLKAELAAREAEIAGLKAALQERAATGGQVVALSVGAGITRGNRGLAPSSSLSAGEAGRVGKMMGMLKPGTETFTVMATGSMKPIFDETSVLLTEGAKFEDLKVGDIVLYRHPKLGVPVAHRLIEKSGDRFWVKGDANGKADNVYVTRENYMRRVYAVIYGGGS